MRGVILAGGNGTRLRPLTYITNKHLLPIYDRPMIEYPIATLKALGIRDILIVSGGDHIGSFAEYLGDGSTHGIRLTYRVQQEAGGIAQALSLANGFVDPASPFVTILGDNIYDSAKIGKEFFPRFKEACIAVKEVKNPHRFGVVSFDGEVPTEIVEKPEQPKSNWAVTGIYAYPPDVFNVIRTLKPSARGELEITDVNNYYLQEKRLVVHKYDGFWSDAGTHDSLLSSANWAQSNAK